MAIELVVTRPFAGFARGDVISDPAEVAKVLGAETADHVVKRTAAEPPAVPVPPAA